jgi:cell division protein FtsW (lipid II flippase)
MSSVKPFVRDRLALLCTAFGVSIGLVSVQSLIFYQGLSDEWFLMTVFTAFLFGTSGYMCLAWVRKERLRRTWPLIVTFLGLLTLHCGIVGSVIHMHHSRWHAPGWLALLFVEIPIVIFALELAHEYSRAQRAMSFSDFLRSIRDRREVW